MVVVKPLLEVVQARCEHTVAAPAAVAVEFDHAEKVLGRRIHRRLERPGRAEGNFKEGPAIHTRHVYGGRFDTIVELERVIPVRSPHEREPDLRGPLADRQGAPVPRQTTLDQRLILSGANENETFRQTSRLQRNRDGDKRYEEKYSHEFES